MNSNNQIVTDRYVIRLVNDKIDANEGIQLVSSPKCGAISVFLGTTRDCEKGENVTKVSHLYYEAYNEMALKQMQRIVEENMLINHMIDKYFIAHRLGCVRVGESSILIACSSAHRTDSHEMTMKLLNRIKAEVPIWKKIFFKDNNYKSEWSDKSDAFWLNK